MCRYVHGMCVLLTHLHPRTQRHVGCLAQFFSWVCRGTFCVFGLKFVLQGVRTRILNIYFISFIFVSQHVQDAFMSALLSDRLPNFSPRTKPKSLVSSVSFTISQSVGLSIRRPRPITALSLQLQPSFWARRYFKASLKGRKCFGASPAADRAAHHLHSSPTFCVFFPTSAQLVLKLGFRFCEFYQPFLVLFSITFTIFVKKSKIQSPGFSVTSLWQWSKINVPNVFVTIREGADHSCALSRSVAEPNYAGRRPDSGRNTSLQTFECRRRRVFWREGAFCSEIGTALLLKMWISIYL